VSVAATFDVRGNNLDELMRGAHEQAVKLVGGRRYSFDMDVTPRVHAEAFDSPIAWIAEVALTVDEDDVE
jgi:hypothetical protein